MVLRKKEVNRQLVKFVRWKKRIGLNKTTILIIIKKNFIKGRGSRQC